MDCIFCKIINKETPADIVYEDETTLGFNNIRPEAPIHLLFVPKKHLEWQGNLSPADSGLISGLISAAKAVAKVKKTADAYKLIFNVGETGHIPHIHLHLLGGWKGEVSLHNI